MRCGVVGWGWSGSVRRSPYSNRLPVVALLLWECCPPRAEDLRKARVVNFEGLALEVEFVDTVVVVKPDDRLVRAGFAVVVGVFDPTSNLSVVETESTRTRATVPSV